MMLADAGVLLSAYRPDAPDHARCRKWLDGVIAEKRLFGLSTEVLAAVVRMATTPRVFDPPSDMADAIGFCEELLGQPHAVLIDPSDRHWTLFTGLCAESGISGSRVTDAWFAALALEHGCEWITLDPGYAGFARLKWREPEAA